MNTLRNVCVGGDWWQSLPGTWFFGSMLILGVTASILARFKTPPELGILESWSATSGCPNSYTLPTER